MLERSVGALRDPAQAEHESLKLLVGEHERRQHESRPEDEAKPGFAVDRRALADQRLDVAVDRPQRDAEFVSERLAAHRPTVAAQHLNEFEQRCERAMVAPVGSLPLSPYAVSFCQECSGRRAQGGG